MGGGVGEASGVRSGSRGFPSISHFEPWGRGSHSIVAALEGGILTSRDPFPYLFLVAVEAGNLLRGLLLLLLHPFTLLLPEPSRVAVLAHVALSGLPIHDVEHVATAVLPRFMAGDVREDAWRALRACGGRRVVVTAWPRVVVAAFVKGYLGKDAEVVGSEVRIGKVTGRVTGLRGGVVEGRRRREEVEEVFGGEGPEVGVGSAESDHHFMHICKEAFMVHPDPSAKKVPPNLLESITIFYDGRFVNKPDPLHALLVFLWLPIALPLSLLRISFFLLSLPPPIARLCLRLTGVRLIFHGTPPPPSHPHATPSRLFVLNHRNNLDPIFICLALGRRLPCVTYKLNRLFRLLSPIPTYELVRERRTDGATISSLLQEGDLMMCPEGTIARGPFLLRFSALFAELTDNIVPVAIETKEMLFHGTTFRGSKIVDPFFFFMNPRPTYEVTFLERVPPEKTCGGGGKSRIEVANHVQEVLGERLGFKCIRLARKDKYRVLGREDGFEGSFLPSNHKYC